MKSGITAKIAAIPVFSILVYGMVMRGNAAQIADRLVLEEAAAGAAEYVEFNIVPTQEEVAQIIAENKAIAEDIKTKAVIQLVTGIAQGVLSIAQGMVSMGMTAGGLKSAQKAANDASRQSMDVSTQHGTIPLNEQQMNAAMAKAENAAAIAQQNTVMMVNARVQGFNAAAGGVNSIIGAVGQSLATGKDAAIKIKESETERMRATQQMLESLDESLKALIQKTLSAQDSIQQNMNATRTKILS